MAKLDGSSSSWSCSPKKRTLAASDGVGAASFEVMAIVVGACLVPDSD